MSDWFRDGDLLIDYRACRVWLGGQEINISALRFKILSYLAEKAGQPVSPREILRHAWPDEQYDAGLVRWHISRLRQVLNDIPPRRIVHVRGFGYRYDRVESEVFIPKRAQVKERDLHGRPRIRRTHIVSCKPSRLKTVVSSIVRTPYSTNGSSSPELDAAD